MTKLTTDENYIDVKDIPLDQWLALLTKPRAKTTFINCEFPTDKHREEYISRIDKWSEREIRFLLRMFLLPSTTLGKDEFSMVWLEELFKVDPERCRSLLNFTYFQRLLYHSKVDQSFPVWEGNTWVMDLLPYFPKEAIAALNAYALAHAQWLPDGRFRGTFDAIEVIRARYIGMPGTQSEKIEFLAGLSPREFECLVERLYNTLGYDTKLTSASKDEGRDVIARRSLPGMREEVRVECKHYLTKPVGPHILRALLGVVTSEKANKGVVVTNSRFTSGAKRFSQSNPGVEIISGDELCLLLNEHLGPSWPLHIERLVSNSEAKATLAQGQKTR